MRHLTQLADDVRRWAEGEDAVRAVLWYGTLALGRSSPHSDVDAAVVHRGTASDVVASLQRFLGDRVREVAFIASRGEAAIWVDEALTKIDLRTAGSPDDLVSMATSPDVPAPRFVVVLDKDGSCGEIAEAAAAQLPRDLGALVNEEIEKFLVAFEAASNAHRRSDGYRFYFEYNLALHRLARLVELARGGDAYLFLPRMLLSGRMRRDEQERFRALHGELYLPEAAALKQRLVDAFLDAIDEVARRFAVRRDRDSLRRFLNSVLERDLFYNLRDFADAFDGRVRRGVLFRGSTLSRWTGTPELNAWLSARNVRRVLDFRDADEAKAKHAYPADWTLRLDVRALPLSAKPGARGAPSGRPIGEGYYRTFLAHLSNVAGALRMIADPVDGAVVVHCYAGKDRTGWFCAALALLLGLDGEFIVDDFLRSGQDTKEPAIREFLELVQEGGGAESHLDRAGFVASDVARLRGRLLAADAPA
ncbi:MAG: tyrosine-protein phosphatase [Planctomycetes bacterium]|nr:tyrosine-protein phosphatase [Planctomycetota bacterium]